MLLKDIGIKNAEFEKSLDVDCLHARPYSDIHRTCRNKCLPKLFTRLADVFFSVF